MDKFIKWLFHKLQSRDSKTIELHFQALNVWWLFILWNPSASVSLDITSPLYIYLLGVWTGGLIFVGVAAMLSNRIFLRLGVVLSYVLFYFSTGFNILWNAPTNPFGGIFICQGLLATLLLWKLRAVEGTVRE